MAAAALRPLGCNVMNPVHGDAPSSETYDHVRTTGRAFLASEVQDLWRKEEWKYGRKKIHSLSPPPYLLVGIGLLSRTLMDSLGSARLSPRAAAFTESNSQGRHLDLGYPAW